MGIVIRRATTLNASGMVGTAKEAVGSLINLTQEEIKADGEWDLMNVRSRVKSNRQPVN